MGDNKSMKNNKLTWYEKATIECRNDNPLWMERLVADDNLNILDKGLKYTLLRYKTKIKLFYIDNIK